MNKKQIKYLLGYWGLNKPSLIVGGMLIGGGLVYRVLGGEDAGTIIMGVGGISIAAGLFGKVGNPDKWVLKRKIKEIKKNKKCFPLECVEQVVIDDQQGLERLLDKTNKNDSLEWGTFLKTYEDKGKAVIYDVMDSREAEDSRLIEEKTDTSMVFCIQEARALGYNGHHHYHPSGDGSDNYAINAVDRNTRINWLNLLSFNMPEGPEIIGYNRQYVYIPNNKEKTRLVKATPRQIMRYLR